MEKLLSAQHVAGFLGIHIKTLYKLLRENRISLNFIRVHGNKIAFRPADVERFVSTREVNRDGSGSVRKKKPRKVRKPKEYRFLTDAEAQDFFTGAKRDPEGNLVSHPDS